MCGPVERANSTHAGASENVVDEAHALMDWSDLVEGVKKEDEGTYTCRVQNKFASEEASAFLTVTGIGQLYSR